MTHQKQDHTNTIYFLTGLLLGSLAGATASLLIAPQSGQQTRDQIQAKGIELRAAAAEAIEKTTEQALRKGQQISSDVREKAGELQQRGQTMLDQQRENLSTFVEGRNKDIEVPA